jgi:hypothetical protein
MLLHVTACVDTVFGKLTEKSGIALPRKREILKKLGLVTRDSVVVGT